MASPCCEHPFTVNPRKSIFTVRNVSKVNFVQSEEHQQELSSLYKPLTARQTRIIRLDRTSDGRLTAKMILIDLRAPLIQSKWPYDALSYVSGSQEPTEVIECNGVKVPITQNLATILHCIRQDRRSPFYIWVDAICINQKDMREKSSQMLKVMEVFSKASTVIAWLGEDDMDGLLVFSFIKESITAKEQLDKLMAAKKHCRKCEARVKPLYTALTRFCERQWFKRLWSLPEMFGAQHTVIMVGSSQKNGRECTYDWWSWHAFDTLVIAMVKLKNSPAFASDLPSSSRFIDLLHDFDFTWWSNSSPAPQPRNFSELLTLRPRELDVPTDLDAVYAILAICAVPAYDGPPYDSHPEGDDAHLGIRVDYSRTPADVFQDATLYILRRRASPGDLANLWNFHEPLPRSPLHPRWIPDFRHLSPLLPPDVDLEPFPAYLTPEHISPETFPWPEIHRSPPSSPHGEPCVYLRLFMRATNYIAHLTPYTFSHDSFVRNPVPIHLLPAGRAIDSSWNRPKRRWWKPFSGTPQPSSLQFLDPARLPGENYFCEGEHRRRLAILGVGAGGEESFALVPAEAKVGDLIVAVGKGLPIVISPRGNGGEVGIAWGEIGGRDEEITEWRIREWGEKAVRKLEKFGEEMRKLVVGGRMWEGVRGAWRETTVHWKHITIWTIMIEIYVFAFQVLSIVRHWSIPGIVFLFLAPVFPLSFTFGFRLVVALKAWLRTTDIGLSRLWHKAFTAGMQARESTLEKAIQRRREVVRGYLDRVTEEMGEEWEFVGPLLVRHSDDRGEVEKRPIQKISLY